VAGAIILDRGAWLGYRWRRHGLADGSTEDVLDDLLLLGVQGSRQGGAVQALSARARAVDGASVAGAVTTDGPLVTMWSVRGAPHAHRVNQLDLVRDALAPVESDDGGAAHVAAVEEVARALRAAVRGRTAKGDASAEVTRAVSSSLVSYCQRCAATHVPEGLFRAAGRQAQLVLGPDERRGTVLYPRPAHRQEPVGADPRLDLLRAYLRVNGPTSRGAYRDWLVGGVGNEGAAGVGELWRRLGDELVRVEVDGRRYDVPESLVTAVRAASAPSGVALVPPNDPYLRQVDRVLLLPDARRRKEVWKALSGPGALLVDGEVAGTWRYRRGDRTLTISAFDAVAPARRAAAERAAARVAGATGDPRPAVRWD